jgi:hypothetical protein
VTRCPNKHQIDHIIEARNGGPTLQANGRLGCGYHNRWRNTHPDDWHEPADEPPAPDAGPDPPDR